MQNLHHLLAAFRKHPAVLQIVQNIDNQSNTARIQLKGLSGAQESFVVAAVVETPLKKKMACHLFLANTKDEAAYRHNDLEGLLPDHSLYFFPDSFKSPASFDLLNPTQMLQRSELISKITGTESSENTVIVTYPEALFEKVVRPEVLNQSRIEVKKGEQLDADFAIQVLVEYGFERADFVYEPGQFSIRGGIIDLFSYGNEYPYRIELLDDEVETIRTFDPTTQLSQKNLSSLSIVPNLSTRFRQDQKVSLFQILPENTVIWIKNYQFLLDRLTYCFDRAEQFATKLTALDSAELRELFRDRAFLYPGDVLEDISDNALIYVDTPM